MKKRAAPPKKGKAAANSERNAGDFAANMASEPALLPSMLEAGPSEQPDLTKRELKMKSKKSKAPAPGPLNTMLDMFEAATENVQGLEEEYVEASKATALKASAETSRKAVVSFDLDEDLKDRQTFPLRHLLTIISRLNPGNNNILDYSGWAQVTDAVFSSITQLPSVNQNMKPKLASVIGLRLTGCYFLTDKGVECIAECFPRLKKLYLAGCPNVTETSLAVLAKKCSSLETLDVTGTSVTVIPRTLADLILVTDTCPLVSENPPVPAKDMAKVCVVRRSGQSDTSILRLLQGDKELSAPQELGFKPNVPCGKDCLINIVECSQTTLDLFTCGWAVYVIPSELKDKTKIDEEAKSIFAIIQSVLFKSGTGSFIVLGVNTAQSGVVPTDIVVEHVQELVKDHIASILLSKPGETDPTSIGHQLQLDQAERQRVCLQKLAVSALEINLGQLEKATSKLTDLLSATCATNPESKIFSKALGDFMQGFPEQGGKDLKVGLHTLTQAADILLQGTAFGTSPEAQGAVLFLTKVGKISRWKNSDGTDVYVGTANLCKMINSLLDPNFAGTTNNAQVPMVSDATVILQEAEVEERMNKAKITASVLAQLIEQVGVLGIRGIPGNAVIPFSCLPDTPHISLDRFAKPSGNGSAHCTQASYIFCLAVPVPPSLWQKALTRITAVHMPLYVWKHGVIVQDGIVELQVIVVGATLTILAQTISVGASDSVNTRGRCLKMLWQCLDKYKLLVDQLFTRSGFLPKIVCHSDEPKPDGVKGVAQGHLIPSGSSSRCKICGESKQQITMLQDASAETEPTLLSADSVKFFTDKAARQGGRVTGSIIHLAPSGTAVLSAGINGMRKQMCSIILLSGSFHRLSLQISGIQGKTVVKFGDKETLNLARKSGKGEVGKLLPGVSINITFCPVSDSQLDCIVDCRGEVLFQQSLPISRYRIDIHHSNEDGKRKSEVSYEDEVHFTVLSQQFSALDRSDIGVGMRLEALDRLNPSLVCVATVAAIEPDHSGGSILIHFDGWTSKYDYWAERDSKDLHPLGYMNEVGRFNHSYNSQLQAPKGYGKHFDWATYLKEVGAEPVPYDFFTEEQTAGTRFDKTLEVSFELGLDSLSESKYQLCNKTKDRTSVLENWVREQLTKSDASDTATLQSFVKLNPRLFCLLPLGLDVQFLRYPSLMSLFQPENQALHMLCSGQNSFFHLVDHPGLNFSSLSKSYSGLELFLQCSYLLLLNNERTIPVDGEELCKGIETVPADQQHRIELGAKRLYRLYLMLFHFLHDPTVPKDKEKSLTVNLGQHSLQLKTVLENGFKSHNLGQKFNHSDFSKLECRAHQAAHSVGLDLATFPVDVFRGMGSTITRLNFSDNKLEILPQEFPKLFPNMTHLQLANNQLQSIPSLAGLKFLSNLDVSSNQLKSIELSKDLKNTLVTLNISNNPLNGISPSLSSCCLELTELLADNIGTIQSLDMLLELSKLTKLSLNYNVITALPDRLSELPLTTLNLAGTPLLQPLTSASAALSLKAVLAFAKKSVAMAAMTEEEWKVLFIDADKDGSGTLGNDGIALLNQKLLARFPRLGQVGKIPGASIPPVLKKMHSLKKLDLSYQGLVTVTDEIKSLIRLSVLSLNGCPKLESLPGELATLPLKELHLRDCLSLKTPPKEIVKRGFHAVYGYLKRLQMGSVPCKRTKLMMVGLGGAGKTSLVRSLTQRQFHVQYDYDEMITDGIDIGQWEVPIKGEKEPLQFSVWDFAGQTVYYNTHQFFLSNRAVYLLLWNIRLGYEHAGLDFWLSSIACHAPKAPVLVVGTHCDKVKKSRIPQAELKKRFPQISSFHFVSSYTGEGLKYLKEDLVTVTLQQKYMGEKIPEVWLNLETQLLSIRDSGEKALLPWKEVQNAAQKSGIFDNTELIQAVQFLHDLGSVQFFNTDFLRSNVVIVPQWIVDVMACIVTVHTGPVQNGLLMHEDMQEVWQAYPQELHSWLLRLTEEFDLTFQLNDKKANIIPCLLPDTEPEYKWPETKRERGEREMKMTYKFDYLPAGLFNRSQVRLHQFSDHSVMWKKGSMLVKNAHVALMLQIGNSEVHVKAQGFKPENMLFLVHEVFECLIAESYAGVHYDYLIPCMECIAQSAADPCMFPRSKVQRAMEFKAPFLQCDSSFHILSILEIQAAMPPERNSDFDDHLSRSVRELHSLEEDVVISVFVCYSKKNIPSLADEGKLVHPATVLEDLRAAGYRVSYTDEPETANMETLTLSMKSAQVVLIGISDEFVSNEQCHNLIIYAKETLNKPILLMTLGHTSKWQKQNINIVLSNEVYVKMQDASRYPSKIKELVEAVKTKAGHRNVETYPECFISYCWANSKTAADLGSSSTPKAQGWGDPRKIKDFLTSRKVPCWLDIEQMGQEGFFEDIAEGLRKAKVMVACVSDEYAESKNCVMEYRFALATLRIPVILAVVGTGYQWERSPVGMMAVGQGCPKVNLQYENEAGLLELYAQVQAVLERDAAKKPKQEELSSNDQRKIAFQEVLELTQRKFLRQLGMYTDASDQNAFPRLVVIDLVDKESQGQGQGKTEEQAMVSDEQKEDRPDISQTKKSEEEEKKESAEAASAPASDQYCFRVLCEWEQGWHESPSVIAFPQEAAENDTFLKEVAPYCARMMAILRHTPLPLLVLTSPQGEQLCKNFEEWSPRSGTEFQAEYIRLLDVVMQQDAEETFGGLHRCHMSNGKQLWLCERHRKLAGITMEDKSEGAAESSVPAALGVTHTKSSKTGEDSEDNSDDDRTEEEAVVPAPSSTSQKPKERPTSEKKLNRATSRACRLM